MTHRLRIAVASTGLGHVNRGIEAWAHDLGYALAARGVDVTLFKGAGEKETEFERVVPCATRDSKATQRLLRYLPKRFFWRLGFGIGYDVEQATFAKNLIPLLRRGRYDLLHVQDPWLALWVQRAGGLGLLKTKVILAHGTEEPIEFQKKFDYFQHLAPWHMEESRQQGAWKPTWTAIPNFIDTDRFKPGTSPELREELGIPQDALVVLTAAAIKRHHKRIDYLLDEFEMLRKKLPDLPAWLVIAGGWEPETDQLIEDGTRRLGDRVRFLPRFPRTRMPELYRAADLFVLASLKEMMPIAVIEATSSGLPCIVNNHPVLEWMVGPGGITNDLAQTGRLAESMSSLLSDRDRRNELKLRAREHCCSNFAEEPVLRQILAYYGSIASTSEIR